MKDKDMMFMVQIEFATGGKRSYRMKGLKRVEKHVKEVRRQKNVADVTATQINE